jgi:MoaA/NifB/PqqE/SkfB family radical SAM enzyme
MDLHHTTRLLQTKYSVIDLIDLNTFTDPGELYKRVLKLKRDQFQNQERIVFVYSKNKLKFLLEILSEIDIPNFFIIILSHDKTISANNITVIYYIGECIDNNISFDLSDIHCIYPWVNIVIQNSGHLNPCCAYKGTPEHNITNILLESYYESMHNLRDLFRSGQKSDNCKVCWKNEAAGIPSMRQMAKHKLQDIYYLIDYSKDIFSNLQMLDLKLGNTCNLSCRICNNTASSKIAKEDLLHNKISNKKFIEIKKASQWSESEEFQDQLLSVANNLTYLDIYGGEPLLSKTHFKFLNQLIELGVADKIKIDYNTNGTVYSEKFFEYWAHFKEIKLSFSIDDIGRRFELERNGASWETVCNNINKFNLKKSIRFKTDVYPTVSILNVYYIPELLDWINHQEFSQPPSFNTLMDPNYFAINNLPVSVKNIVAEKLNCVEQLRPIVNYMMQEGNDLIDTTIQQIRLLDQIRGQNFADTHLDFANIIEYR